MTLTETEETCVDESYVAIGVSVFCLAAPPSAHMTGLTDCEQGESDQELVILADVRVERAFVGCLPVLVQRHL